MQPSSPLTLLGGLSPVQFMKTYWQKKPLLVRAAIPGFAPLVPRSRLFAMAAQDDVESRLVERRAEQWKVRPGPLARRALPPIAHSDWTLLVQGMDLHDGAVHALMAKFRFAPDARLDDLMISYATDGGGVGPHVDSYDVFLLQAMGQRRWRIGPAENLRLLPDVPLKILAEFRPEEEYVLEPGDMLYLPPGWAHDGVAQGECMTYSIGFRAPERDEIARDLLGRMSEDEDDTGEGLSEVQGRRVLYRDPTQAATEAPAEIPGGVATFARRALERALRKPLALERALGESLTEPKPQVWFDTQGAFDPRDGVFLDRRSRMLYDAHHVFINGESYRASGRDAALMRKLANQRLLSIADLNRASEAAIDLLQSWGESGWLVPESSPAEVNNAN